MGLFKEVKKPLIQSVAAASEISQLRPRFVPKAPPCASGCPNGNEIRELLAQQTGLVRIREQWVELDREKLQAALEKVCGGHAEVLTCGAGVVEPLTTVVRVVRITAGRRRGSR